MEPYHSIPNPFKRSADGKTIAHGVWSTPELEYLKDCPWRFTEKIDGMNVRVMWDGESVRFNGRTDNASMPTPLLERLFALFPRDIFADKFGADTKVCLYGEGYGGKIQGNSKLYGQQQNFILFDVKVGDWWLSHDNVTDIAAAFAIDVVPTISIGEVKTAIEIVTSGLSSHFGEFEPEGLVGKPEGVTLFDRKGERIAVKVKARDFSKLRTQ